MKNSISLISLILISLLGVSCVGSKKTGVSVYQDKGKGQPYNDPYASSDFYNQPVGDPYVPPTGGDFGIEPPRLLVITHLNQRIQHLHPRVFIRWRKVIHYTVSLETTAPRLQLFNRQMESMEVSSELVRES